MPSGFNSSQAGPIVAPSKTKASGFKPKSSVLPATVSQPNYKTRAVRPGGYRKGGLTKRPGFFLGGMFAGTPAQSTQQTSSNFNQNTAFDPIYTNYFHDTLNRSEGLYDQMKGKTAEDAIAGFTPDQLAAQQGVRNVQGNYQPYFQRALSGFDQAQQAAAGVGTAGAGAFGRAASGPTALDTANPYATAASGTFNDNMSSYMSPYLNQSRDFMAQGVTQNLMENILPKVNDTFTGGAAGQFGRERHADITGRAIRDANNTIAGKSAEMFNQGYGTAGNLFMSDQSRLAGLAGTMGGLAQGQMSGFGTLGSQLTSAAAQGVQSQVAAGQAQQQLGKDVQAAGYTDLNALMTSGQQQQQLAQQQKTFGMQYPWQLLQTMQGLGQGWNVGSSTSGTSNSSSYGTQQAAQASPAAQIMGGVLGVAGLGMPGGGTLGGNMLGAAMGVGGQGAGGSGGTAGGATGGHFDGARFKKEYGAGGYAPVVSGVRAMTAKRQPAIKARMMQQSNGLAPPQMTGFARGGSADVAQDKAMVRKGVWQHERQMHGAKKGELTPLKNLRRGGRARFAEGGDSGYFRFMGDNPAPLEAMTAEERKADRARQRAQRGYWGRTKDDVGEMAGGIYDLMRMSPELAREGVRNIDKVPGIVGDAFADAGRQYYDDPLGTVWKGVQHYLPQNIYGRMVDSSRDLFRGLSDDEGTLLSSASAALGASPAGITPQGNVRRALISAFAR